MGSITLFSVFLDVIHKEITSWKRKSEFKFLEEWTSMAIKGLQQFKCELIKEVERKRKTCVDLSYDKDDKKISVSIATSNCC